VSFNALEREHKPTYKCIRTAKKEPIEGVHLDISALDLRRRSAMFISDRKTMMKEQSMDLQQGDRMHTY
jgi:hypothetical protein